MVWAATYALATISTYKAGANVSATATGAAYLLAFAQMAEGYINSATQYNWSDAVTAAALDDDVLGILQDAGSSFVAMCVINYDLSGMSAREAETRLDFLYNSLTKDIELLKLAIVKDFVVGA
jgi:hypothetical protein